MRAAIPRRSVVLLGLAAAGAATAIAASRIPLASERKIMRYEEGLEGYFKAGLASLTLVALAHLAGLSSRLPSWLSLARQADPKPDWDGLLPLFESLLTGDVALIEVAVRSADIRILGFPDWIDLDEIDRSSPEGLDEAVEKVVDALTLLGRGDLVATLHARSLQRLSPARRSFTDSAACTLAQAADWPHALEVLEEARRMRRDIDLLDVTEDFIWKYAYLHGEIERAMPVLAQVTSRNDKPHSADDRAWRLKAYRIRAGHRGIDIPIIETDRLFYYVQAAAMQLAALEGDPAAADMVQSLRRGLRPQPVQMIHAHRWLPPRYDIVESAVSIGRAAIAARRKDYAKAAELARAPVRGLLDPAVHVIEALLDEGDWRAAAAIAREHDQRRTNVIPGVDDLSLRFAQMAAWSGDDGAAAGFYAAVEDVYLTSRRMKVDDLKDVHWLSWPKTTLAGAAEGLLPRKLLPVLQSFLMP